LVTLSHLEADMDPTNQQPGQPAPPWGTDPQPEAPQPGQPTSPWSAPVESAPSWAAEPQPEAPQPEAPQPEAPQPGQPTPPWAAPGQQTPPWAAPGQPGAPQPYMPGQPWPQVPQKSGGRGKLIGVFVIIAIVVIGGIFAFVRMQGLADRGKVLFSTDAPAADPKGCSVSNQVTTVGASTHVYATYIYTDTQGSDVVTLAISKDGVELGSFAVPTSDTSGADCTTDSSDLSTDVPGWGAGSWKFTLTASGKTVSEGTLTVTP
jgi:hypothetical protein